MHQAHGNEFINTERRVRLTNTCSTTETINVVTRYIDMYCDLNIKDHNTEYHMNSYNIEGGTSIDVVELPSYTPGICKLIQVSTRHQMVMVEKRIRVRRVIKEKEPGWKRLNSPWFFFFCKVGAKR